jgi:hypothetical protein
MYLCTVHMYNYSVYLFTETFWVHFQFLIMFRHISQCVALQPGAVVIASASRTEDPGFESHQDVRFF